MNREELRKRALSLVSIPADFKPIIEEYAEGENGEGEAIFSWANEEKDKGITINLDLVGNLTSLSIDMDDGRDPNPVPLEVEERKERAEQFFLSHYPDALSDLTFYEIKKLDQAFRFNYERIIMNLPLKSAGCFIDVDQVGNIIKFSYKVAGHIPEIPTILISKEKLIEHEQNRLDFQQTITNLYTIIHDVEEDDLRLVYEPEPSFMKYRADILTPTLSIIHDEDVPETYVPLPPSNTTKQKDLSIKEVIGIREGMEIIREVDMGGETGIVWRDRNWEMKDQDLSIDGFFKRHSEDTVKAFISKKTGKVRSFMWFNERSGDLKLTHEECLQKATDFLQMILPDYHKYLQLIVRENEDEVDDTRKNEAFSFRIHNGNGIPVQLEIVIVAVNRETGQIDHYSGPSFDMEQLSQIPTEPAISKKEARKIFFSHLDFELAWNKDYDEETESHILVYQACDRFTRTPIRYIDAMTGAVITAKDK
ncbi:YcdB/YcdC domain-containing protein [Robertmurraya beringensis]|uniref:YcdB/YcdC domain-containing protein n=1 Tax=Robertmurraya beringensis TaxID=641660 RepID=A0ABV6KNV6_9BACI